MNKLKVKKINYKDTYSVRSVVLRPGKPMSSCFFNGDEKEETTHFGLFYKNNLIGVASVFKINNDLFKGNIHFQLRGMAVLNEYQGLGYGKIIMENVCNFVEVKKAHVLWFNARENAVPFYTNFGFSICGDSFEIAEIGTHFLMYKHFAV
jgi:predicted GNAT family N-acyltransferase